jgi:hypothetical protein
VRVKLAAVGSRPLFRRDASAAAAALAGALALVWLMIRASSLRFGLGLSVCDWMRLDCAGLGS